MITLSLICAAALLSFLMYRLGAAIEAEKRYRADLDTARDLRWRLRHPKYLGREDMP